MLEVLPLESFDDPQNLFHFKNYLLSVHKIIKDSPTCSFAKENMMRVHRVTFMSSGKYLSASAPLYWAQFV